MDNPLEVEQSQSREAPKLIRLVEFLSRLASLRMKLIRDILSYEKTLWISSIPKEKGCFTAAWGGDDSIDSDIWVEIQGQREPRLPSPPNLCEEWIDQGALRNKRDIPDLLQEVTVLVQNQDWQEETGEEEYFSETKYLRDFPEVQRAWETYVEGKWLGWIGHHDKWEKVQKVYSSLFSIYQEQVRLGEQYELVLCLGLLTWTTDSGQTVRRHLLAANASLEFEARLGRFTVRPMPDGAALRPELDMLDITERPLRAEEAAKAGIAGANDDPWDVGCIEGVLQALVHAINPHGEYNSTLSSQISRASGKPIVELAPALVLRKRSARGLAETLGRIKGRIEDGGEVPQEFLDLAEVGDEGGIEVDDNGEGKPTTISEEIYFPKPSNEEQRKIIGKMKSSTGVLVQGPPGTGKSHTIANLICHLLATGKRILVTAKTPRALKVLEKHVPSELRPLCINLLGSGMEERRSLESSVGGILRKNEEWDGGQASREGEEYEASLYALRKEKAEIERRLREVREAETHQMSIAEGSFQGTAARIAQAVDRERESFDWLTDSVPCEASCPVTSDELQKVLQGLRKFSQSERTSLSHWWPESIVSIETFTELINLEERCIEEVRELEANADIKIRQVLNKADVSKVEQLLVALMEFKHSSSQVMGATVPWVKEAISDSLNGNTSVWRELHQACLETVHSAKSSVRLADDSSLEVPEIYNVRGVYKDARRLKSHLKSGGKLGFGPIRPKLVRECAYLLKEIKLDGRPCRTTRDFSNLVAILHVRMEYEKAWGFWAGRVERTSGPLRLQQKELSVLCETLDEVLDLEGVVNSCRGALGFCSGVEEPNWAHEAHVSALISSCRYILAVKALNDAEDSIRVIQDPLSARDARGNSHPVVAGLLEGIRNREVSKISDALNYLVQLNTARQQLSQLDAQMEQIKATLPRLIEELCGDHDSPLWEERFNEIHRAWHWSQARDWVEEFIGKADTQALERRAKQIEDEIGGVIENLASIKAWTFCFSRLKETHRRHMEAWKQSMGRVGKGTGKHAPRHRREAKQHLNECRESVPAWVMPLHRVWDTVDPSPGMFDVVIVDEASQCGVEALPLYYLAKKVLIVGDDKQISPDAVGLPRDAVHRLMEEFLGDFRFKSSFAIESSLFDHGKLRYGLQRITLREHFRCMPEIIQFSNDLCYADTPLVPLRQFGADRLPPLQHVFINDGFREGRGNGVINKPEAEAVVSKIVELSKNTSYSGKTFGVVVLQGEAQGALIEGKLLVELGAEEMEKRQIVCGNPYSFQGDERDVMLLSMVAAPNERIGPLTKAADERRFNVAVSRARDQIILFHSVRTDDLSEACLRKRLIDFFQNTRPPEISGIRREEIEARAMLDNRMIVKPPAPFDSWFEVDVALEISRKGFLVIPQYAFAGKRIDLVVQEGGKQLAIECDGDHWHGPENYEKDMVRQRQLERSGWEFFRIRESAFYAGPKASLLELWRLLGARGFRGKEAVLDSSLDEPGEGTNAGSVSAEVGIEKGEDLGGATIKEHEVSGDIAQSRRSEEVSAAEISRAILSSLSACPNKSCTVQSLTTRVLRELSVLTRGKPRAKFEKRVLRMMNALAVKGLLERYKAKNERVRMQ